MKMKWLGAWLVRNELESPSHMWTQNNKRVSMRLSQMNENDPTICKYIQWLESIQKVMD